jgi:Glycosyl transferase family 2
MPCHREPPAVDLVERLLTHLPRVLLVDDGMPAAEAQGLDRLASASGAKALHLPRRSGKGHAIATGLAALRADPRRVSGVLVVDADGQHPPECIPDFLAASEAADLVIGNRFADGAGCMPAVRRVANRISSAVVSQTSGALVPDSQCGMRLLLRRALFDVPFPAGGMESETRHLKRCLETGVPVTWVPIPAVYRGELSAFRPVRDSVAVMRAAAGR